MIVTDQINGKVRSLPISLQREVLHFVELLLERTGNEADEWSKFSLQQALRGLEDDHLPEYTEADLRERWR